MCKCVYIPTSEMEEKVTSTWYVYIVIMQNIYIKSNVYAPRFPQNK